MKKNLSTCCALDYWATQQPQKIAVYTETDSITYGELHEKASRLAAALKNRGLNPQDHIMIFMPDGIEYFIVFFAAVKLGLNIVPANALYKGTEIHQLILKNQPKLAFVCGEEKIQMVQEADSNLPIIHSCLGDEAFQALLRFKGSIPGFPEDLTSFGVRISTSGSTGKLKFVSKTFYNQLMPSKLIAEALHITKDDVLYIPVPLPQQFGMVAMLGGWINGSTMVVTTHFNCQSAFDLIEKHRITAQYCVPTMYAKEIEAYEAAEVKPDLSSLRVGMLGGAACPIEVIEWFENNLNCLLLNTYGATEIAGIALVDYADSHFARYNTSGRVIKDGRIDIVDDLGNSLPIGGIGEIVCDTPYVMDGYVNEPELTASALDNRRRFWTGDIGKLTEDGYLMICGRKKDMIIRGGYNVFPAEVEELLLQHPNIAEASVMGFKDDLFGERIGAFIVLKNKLQITPQELRQQLKEYITKYKVPDLIIFLDTIPTLANGKHDRPTLTALLKNAVDDYKKEKSL